MAITDSWALPGMLLFADLLLATLILLVSASKRRVDMKHSALRNFSLPRDVDDMRNQVIGLETPVISKATPVKKLRVVGRRENKTGANTHYKLTDGSIVTRAKAVKMVKSGALPGYQIMKVKGKEYLRDEPDTRESDNIDNQELI